MKLYTAIIKIGFGESPKIIEPILANSKAEVYKLLPKIMNIKQIITVEDYEGKLIDLTK